MKKIFSLALLALFMLSILTACGGNSGGNATNQSPINGTGTVYKIADYYDAYGGFSSLGLALDEKNSEKVLMVNEGDTLIVSEHKYMVAVASLVMPFYTQVSLDEVLVWWNDYCESRIERGEMQKAVG